jgi:hypothetical protein
VAGSAVPALVAPLQEAAPQDVIAEGGRVVLTRGFRGTVDVPAKPGGGATGLTAPARGV